MSKARLAAALSIAVALTAAVSVVAWADVVVPKPIIKPAPPPKPSPAAAPSAAPTAPASAAPSLPASAAEAKGLDEDPPKGDKSTAPKPDEWKTAAPVKLAREVPYCKAYRVREWLKVHCSGLPASGVAQLAGPREGVEVWVDTKREGDSEQIRKAPRSAEVVFPLRPGDGRVFQIGQFGEGWDGPIAWNTAVVLSEQWVLGEPYPIVTLR